MKKVIILCLGILLAAGNTYSQTTYPDNEDGRYADMLTPAYYHSQTGDAIRNEINKFVHFARLESFQHPFQDSTGRIIPYITKRGFGDGVGPGSAGEHHGGIDLYVGNRETLVNMYAAHDGFVQTFRDVPKYRHYLSISKSIEDSSGNVIGKMVSLYGHIDLDLDSADNILLDGKYVKQGGIVSKHFYSETRGGPHIQFEVRYYRPADSGSEEFYGFVGAGGNSTLTEPSAGPWPYGFWNPDVGYGFADPENHLSNPILSVMAGELKQKADIFPNPANDIVTINLDEIIPDLSLSIYDSKGQLLSRRDIMSASSIEVSLGRYIPGVYFVNLVGRKSKKSIIAKIIKE